MNDDEIKVVQQYVADMIDLTDDAVSDCDDEGTVKAWPKDREILTRFIEQPVTIKLQETFTITLTKEAAEQIHNFIANNLMVSNELDDVEDLMIQLSELGGW